MKLIPLPLAPLGAPPPLGLWNSDILWRYPPAPASPLNELKSQMPPQLSTDPKLWNRDDVSIFLKWCEREFDLPKFEMDLFQMNGKALCLLTKNDLAERIPGAGDLLHNVIQILVRECQMHRHLPSSPVTPTSRYPLSPHSHPPTPNWQALAPPDSPFHTTHLQHFMATNSVTLSPAPSIDSQTSSPPRQQDTVQVFTKTETSSSSNQSDSDEESYSEGAKVSSQVSQNSPPLTPITKDAPSLPQQITNVVNSWSNHSNHSNNSDKSSPATPLTPGAFLPVKREFFPDTQETNTNGRLLWDFLQQLLNEPSQRFSCYIAWKCRDTGVFKIVDPAGLAKLWGIQKNHLSMNYDKMSRALRYYYRVNILRKVQGERHCYQFLRNPSELKNIKNISLLRQTTPASPSATNSITNTNTNNNTQQSAINNQQQQQQPHHPPPNSPMLSITNGIHHHHLSGNSLSSPSPQQQTPTSQQQFNFPPQQHQQHQQQQHQQHQQNINNKLLISNQTFKIEPKTEINDDMMPTDLSIGSSDRRYMNSSTECYPLIRNSNGLTTITLIQQQQQDEHPMDLENTNNLMNYRNNTNEIMNDKNDDDDDDDVESLPTDLRKRE